MRAFRVAGAAVVAALALIVAGAPPAFAHDELLRSTPSPGEQLSVAPQAVTLEYSANVMTVGAAIIVVDQSGTDWVADTPEIDGGTVSVRLKPDMPVAGYELRWRVVSSDGHPISGIVAFTVGDAKPLVRQSAPASAAPAAGSAGSVDSENQGALRALIIGGIAAVVAVCVFILFSLLRRRKARTLEPRETPLDN